MIIAVGFKVNNPRAVQFRKWAGQIVKDHTIQGWTMDKERLKKGHMFTDEYLVSNYDTNLLTTILIFEEITVFCLRLLGHSLQGKRKIARNEDGKSHGMAGVLRCVAPMRFVQTASAQIAG